MFFHICIVRRHCYTLFLHYCSCLFVHDTSHIYIVHSRNMLIKISSHDVQHLMVVGCLGVSCVKLDLSQPVPSLQSPPRIPHYCGADQVAGPFRPIGQEGRRTSSFVAWVMFMIPWVCHDSWINDVKEWYSIIFDLLSLMNLIYLDDAGEVDFFACSEATSTSTSSWGRFCRNTQLWRPNLGLALRLKSCRNCNIQTLWHSELLMETKRYQH